MASNIEEIVKTSVLKPDAPCFESRFSLPNPPAMLPHNNNNNNNSNNNSYNNDNDSGSVKESGKSYSYENQGRNFYGNNNNNNNHNVNRRQQNYYYGNNKKKNSKPDNNNSKNQAQERYGDARAKQPQKRFNNNNRFSSNFSGSDSANWRMKPAQESQTVDNNGSNNNNKNNHMPHGTEINNNNNDNNNFCSNEKKGNFNNNSSSNVKTSTTRDPPDTSERTNQSYYGARPKLHVHSETFRSDKNFTTDNNNINNSNNNNKLKNDKVKINPTTKFKGAYNNKYGIGRGNDDDDNEGGSKADANLTNDGNQRELLERQLTNGTYECMVCCLAIRRDVAIWYCSLCYHIYHLYCIRKWANSSCTQLLSNSTPDSNSSSSNNNSNTGADNRDVHDGSLIDRCGGVKAWRCPACQNMTTTYPDKNLCFCGKQVDPPYSGYLTPHSCGDMCGKRRNADCKHPCNIPCHPGPCPTCNALVNVTCDCSRMKVSVKCSDSRDIKCQEVCKKLLNCGIHSCSQSCHKSPCDPCRIEVERSCHCSKLNRRVVCGTNDYFVSSYSCGKTCDKPLNCSKHTCDLICHAGPCKTCKLLPHLVTHCPCGKTRLDEIRQPADNGGNTQDSQKPSKKKKDVTMATKSQTNDTQDDNSEKGLKSNNDDEDNNNNNINNINNVRTSCLDPVPCCWKKCNKELECGDPGKPHRCKAKCHSGPCPACDDNMTAPCRCSATNKVLPCREFAELNRQGLPVKCDNRCGKKMSCGRHRCNQNCCIDEEHRCNIICGYKLTCGLHKCEELCHKGRCPTCWRTSFEELTCECGSEVIEPPVPCGTKPPMCIGPCTRAHPCNHPVMHTCHSEPNCPPCTVLTQKWCMCSREKRNNVACFLQDVSCGQMCGKPLPCQVHSCVQLCHKPPCLDGGQSKCTQPCPAPRPACGHPCMAPCHVGQPCPATKCKAKIVVKCECGRREETMICLTDQKLETKDDYSRLAASLLASQLWNSQSIDLSILKDVKNKNRLPCDSTCNIQKRNKVLADALNIENPNVTSEVSGLEFSDFLRDCAKQHSAFAAEVEDVLIQIVKECEKSKDGRKVHFFKSMSSYKRRFIHELAHFYVVATESIDEEPNRSVVATATRNVSHLLQQSLTSFVKHGHIPRPPIPIPANYDEDKLRLAKQAAKLGTAPKLPTSSSFSSSSASCSKNNNVGASGDDDDGEWKTIASKHKKQEPEIDYFDFQS